MLGFADVLARPLLLRPESTELFRDGLGMLDTGREAPVQASAFRGKPVRTRTDAPLYNLEDGAAIVPVVGSTVNRGAWTGSRWGVVSYEGIAAQLDAALADPQVKRIVLDLDCPGGEAAGAFSLGEKVRAASKRKPVTAFVNGCAASAGYAIACGAQRIVASPSAILGSIGVVMVHMDHSQRLGNAGIKPTIIHAGDRKADGSPVRPLSAEARASLQAQIDQVYGLFVDLVAKHRSMPAAAVRATEGRVFMGASAVKAGLADVIGSLDDALGTTAASMPSLSSYLALGAPKGLSMTTPPVLQTQVDPVRLGAIMGLPEAKGFEQAAYELAQGTASIAEARQKLAGMQKAAAQANQASIDATWDTVIAGMNAQHGIPGAGTTAGRLEGAPASPVPPVMPQSTESMWNEAIAKINKEQGLKPER